MKAINCNTGQLALLILVLLIGSRAGLHAQSGDRPDIPDIKRVTVLHPTRDVLIQWEASEDTDVEHYKIYQQQDDESFVEKFTIPGSVYEYVHLTSGLENLTYAVTAVDSAGNESLFADNIHRAVELKTSFDACEPAVKLQWSPYLGWENKVAGYLILGGNTAACSDTLGFVHPASDHFLHTKAEIGRLNYYCIACVHLSGITSYSPVDSLLPEYPPPPAELRIDEVNVLDATRVEISIFSRESGELNNFRLMRSNSPTAAYNEIETLWSAADGLNKIEDQLPTDRKSYSYIVQALYKPPDCIDARVIASSNTGNNILLEASLAEQNSVLTWTPYEEFPNGLASYRIYRESGDGTSLLVGEIAAGSTEWTETLSSLMDGSRRGELIYYLEAIEKEGPEGYGISRSNKARLQLPSRISMPNAFTPKSGDINARFRPHMDFAPRDYSMLIFDRAGRKMYESSEPGEGWDGRFQGGEYVREGVYMYVVEFTDYSGKSSRLNGPVSVLYR